MIDHLETEHLILEPLTMAHAPGQFAVLKDPRISHHIGVFKQPITIEQAEWWCGDVAEKLHADRKGFLCAVFKKSADGKKDGPAIGYLGTAYTDSKQELPSTTWEGGAWLRGPKGYAVEGGKAIMDYVAREFGVTKIYVEMAQANKASWMAAQTFGFKRVAEFIKKTPNDPERPSYRYEMDIPHVT